VDPDPGKKWRKNVLFSNFSHFITEVKKYFKTTGTSMFDLIFKPLKKLSSTDLLWILIRIGSRFNDFLDPDPE
jgi:hypothetical protein